MSSTPMDLRVFTSFLNQLYAPLEKLMGWQDFTWQQLQTSYQTIVERYQRLMNNLGEAQEQTLLYPFKPTGTKTIYPNVYLRSKHEPFIDEYLMSLQGIEYDYDSEIDDTLLLFEAQ
eukprot:NODE_31_length_32452_cov_0.352672.p25 type:complete len:117 gc:universal NODE_31_length_32452_cov_0.352672:8729-9079(+)